MKTKNINLKSIFCSTIIGLSFMTLSAQVTDNGMTHDFHKQNVGKIVFSKTEIAKATQSAESFTNSFNLGDDIYGRVYLAKSLTNELAAIGGDQKDAFRYKVTVDGKPLASSFFDGIIHLRFEQDVLDQWTTFQLAINPSSTDGYQACEFSGFVAAIWELSTGSHKIKYELIAKGSSKESVAASGEFTLNVTEDGKTTAANKICPMISGWYSMDAAYETNLVENSKKAGEKVLKVVILGSDWKYSKDSNGNIKNRWMSGMAFYQDLKTKLCYDVEAIFVQETSNGGISYGATTYSRGGELNYKNVYLESCTTK